MSDLIKLADTSIMYHWLLDRIATGYNYDMIRSLYKESFEYDITLEDYDAFRSKYAEDIRVRYNELKRQIYESGTYVKMQSIADRLYKMVSDGTVDMTPRELASLSDTLRKYLESMTEFGKTRTEARTLVQNNYVLLESLEEEKLIKILNPSRLKYIVDGVVDGEKV